MKAKYAGRFPEVEFKDIVFPKGEWVEVNPLNFDSFPDDFKIKEGDEPKTDPFEELKKVNGIGPETVEDLKEIYNDNFDKLINDAKTKEVEEVPIRDDLAKKLIEKLGE